MLASLRTCLPLALLVLAACSPTTEEQAAAPAPETAAATVPDAAPGPVAVVQEDQQRCRNESRTDENGKRPRCGGMAAPQVTASHAYRITLDNGESITTCDIAKPFSGKIGRGMVTMSFTPADDRSGRVSWHFAGAGGVADTSYEYTLSGPEEKMTGTFVANAAICGKAAGLGACAAAKKQTFTSIWTKIENCGE